MLPVPPRWAGAQGRRQPAEPVFRELQHLIEQGEETTSSSQLGRKLGFTDAQVRKDLAYFGHFGYPGIGYRCDKLVAAIKRILGTDQQWNAVLVGAGNLGRALLGYKGFGDKGFASPPPSTPMPARSDRISKGSGCTHLDELTEFAKANRVRLGIIAVPAPAAQAVANRLVAAGSRGNSQFRPVTIELPDTVSRWASTWPSSWSNCRSPSSAERRKATKPEISARVQSSHSRGRYAVPDISSYLSPTGRLVGGGHARPAGSAVRTGVGREHRRRC